MGKDHYTRGARGHRRDRPGGDGDDASRSSSVFVPVAFMGGIAGQWFKPFALTIACSVLVSLFVSFSLDPMLSAYWPDPHVPMEQRPLHLAAARPLQPLVRPPGRALQARDRAGRSTTASRWSCLAIALVRRRAGAAGDGHRRRRLRARDRTTPSSCIDIETPPGSNLAYTRAEGGGGRAHRAQRAGGARTPTRRSAASGDAVDEGNVYVRLKPKTERARSQAQVVADAARASWYTLGGVDRVDQHRLQPGAEADPAAAAGPGRDELHAARRQDRGTRCSKVPGAVDVGLSTQGPEARARRAARSRAGGIARRDRRPGRAGAAAGVRRHRRRRLDRSLGETRDVTVRLAPESRSVVADLESLPLVVGGGQNGPRSVPLGQVARITRRSGRRGSTTSIASA